MYITFNPNKVGTDMHFRISPTEFIYIKGFAPGTKEGNNFCYERIENHQLKQKLWAEAIKWDTVKKIWHLNTVTERTWNGEAESFNSYASLDKKYDLQPSDIVEVAEQKSCMTSKELLAFISKERRRGNPSLNVYLVEFHRRSGAAFSVLVLTIIGACMASFKVRGGSGLHLALGILISGAYIIFMQFSNTFAIKGNLPPIVAVWIPNIIFSVLAFYIYRKYKG
jgi:lipopolysaccharide export system permease protein